MNLKKIGLMIGWSLLCVLPLQANATRDYWKKVIEAIVEVESRGDLNAVNGRSVGPMQITPIVVTECNLILEQKNSKLRYSLSDRTDLRKSKEMFYLFQEKYNPTKDIEWAIRAWNGGPKFKQKATEQYYRKVLAALK